MPPGPSGGFGIGGRPPGPRGFGPRPPGPRGFGNGGNPPGPSGGFGPGSGCGHQPGPGHQPRPARPCHHGPHHSGPSSGTTTTVLGTVAALPRCHSRYSSTAATTKRTPIRRFFILIWGSRINAFRVRPAPSSTVQSCFRRRPRFHPPTHQLQAHSSPPCRSQTESLHRPPESRQ